MRVDRVLQGRIDDNPLELHAVETRPGAIALGSGNHFDIEVQQNADPHQAVAW
jgi:hypothetical protein